MSIDNQSIIKNSLRLSLLGIIATALGFIVLSMQADKFGASVEMDAYFYALIIPMTYIGIIVGVFKIVIVPGLIEERINNPDNLNNYIRSIMYFSLIASVVGIFIVSWVAYSGIIRIGEDPEVSILLKILLIEMLPLIPLIIFSGLFVSIYNSYQKFGLPEVTRLVQFLLIVISILLLSESFGVHSIVYGYVTSQLVILVFCIWLVRVKLGLNIKLNFKLDSDFRRLIQVSILPLLSYILAQLSPLLIRIFSAFLVVGSISSISYAQKLASIPAIVIGGGFLDVISSYWAKSVSEEQHEKLQSSLNETLAVLMSILIPFVTILYILKDQIIRLLLFRGELGEESLNLIIELFPILLIAILPSYINMLGVRVLFAKQDRKNLFLISLLSLVALASILSVLIFIVDMGVIAVAISILFSNTIAAIFTLYVVHKYHSPIFLVKLFNSIVQAILGSIIMYYFIFFIQGFFASFFEKNGLFIEIICIGLTGLFCYVFLIKLAHPKKLDFIFNSFKN